MIDAAARDKVKDTAKALEVWFHDTTMALIRFAREEPNTGPPRFWIWVEKSGVGHPPHEVPQSAYLDLQNVFTGGGSFTSAALAHMPDTWETLEKVHMSFASLREALGLEKSLDSLISDDALQWKQRGRL